MQPINSYYIKSFDGLKEERWKRFFSSSSELPHVDLTDSPTVKMKQSHKSPSRVIPKHAPSLDLQLGEPPADAAPGAVAEWQHGERVRLPPLVPQPPFNGT